MLTIFQTIQSNKAEVRSDKEINEFYWLTDSSDVFYWFKSGSRKKHIQKIMVDLFRLTSSLRIQLKVI